VYSEKMMGVSVIGLIINIVIILC